MGYLLNKHIYAIKMEIFLFKSISLTCFESQIYNKVGQNFFLDLIFKHPNPMIPLVQILRCMKKQFIQCFRVSQSKLTFYPTPQNLDRPKEPWAQKVRHLGTEPGNVILSPLLRENT